VGGWLGFLMLVLWVLYLLGVIDINAWLRDAGLLPADPLSPPQ